MAGNRKCALCKESLPVHQLVRAGKDYLCKDTIECYKRKLRSA